MFWHVFCEWASRAHAHLNSVRCNACVVVLRHALCCNTLKINGLKHTAGYAKIEQAAVYCSTMHGTMCALQQICILEVCFGANHNSWHPSTSMNIAHVKVMQVNTRQLTQLQLHSFSGSIKNTVYYCRGFIFLL